MYPEQIAKAFLNEAFDERRLVVALFAIVNVVLLITGLLWPASYSGSIRIAIDDRGFIEPLMKGAAVTQDSGDRSVDYREIVLGRNVINRFLRSVSTPGASPEQEEALINRLKSRTTVSRIAGKSAIRIDYRDSSQEQALRVTKLLSDSFIEEMVAAREEDTQAAFDFVDKQAQEYQRKLANAEEELRRLQTTNFEVRGGGDAEVNSRAAGLNSRIENATLELKEAEMKRESLERQVSGEAKMTVLATRENQFRARLAELQGRLDTLRLTLLDTHPDIVQLKNQIGDLKAEAAAERERRAKAPPSEATDSGETVVNNPVYQQLRHELSQNQLTIDALRTRIAEARRLLKEEADRGKALHGEDARMVQLNRDYQINRDIYQDLLRRRERARVSMNIDSEQRGSTFKILEPATVSTSPNAPRFWQFVLAGIVVGILLPFGLLFVRLQLDPRVRVVSTISYRHKVPVVAVIPHIWNPAETVAMRRELLTLALVVAATLALSTMLSVARLLGAF